MDEREEESCEKSSVKRFSKCRKQCNSACDDKGCCSPAYSARPTSTCAVQYTRPCACLQNLRLDYNIVEPWPHNWREEFCKLRKMWSNHSKFSSYDLSDKNSSNGAVVSKYCNTNCCWHERPYRTNSIGVKCAYCCPMKDMRNCDIIDGISHENIPRFCDFDLDYLHPEPSSSRGLCFNRLSDLPQNSRRSNKPESHVICECCAKQQEKQIVPCYSNIYDHEYRNNFEQDAVYCPCCIFMKKQAEELKFGEAFFASEPMKQIQRCYKKYENERAKCTRYPQTQNYPEREERKILRCYRKRSSTGIMYPRERDSDEDMEIDEPGPYVGRQVRDYTLKKGLPRKKIIPHDLRDTEERPRNNERPRTRQETQRSMPPTTNKFPRPPTAPVGAYKQKQISPRKVPHNLQSTISNRQQEQQHIPERLVNAFQNRSASTHTRRLSSDAEPRKAEEKEKKVVHISVGGNDQRKKNTNKKPTNDKSNNIVTIYDDTHPNYMKPETSDFNYEFVKYFPEKDNNSKTYRQRMPRRNLIKEFDESNIDAKGVQMKLK